MAGPNSARDPKPDNDGRHPANVLLDQDAAAFLDSITKPTKSKPFRANIAKGNVLPFERRTAGGYDDEGGVSRFFYVAKASTSERTLPDGTVSMHPTHKPIALTEYLGLHLLLPNPSAKLLVPFCGVGSEILGARNAGWDNITGVEINPDYIAFAERRLGIK